MNPARATSARAPSVALAALALALALGCTTDPEPDSAAGDPTAADPATATGSTPVARLVAAARAAQAPTAQPPTEQPPTAQPPAEPVAPPPATTQVARRLGFDGWDPDGDRLVDIAELGGALFAMTDTDRDGRVDPAELGAASWWLPAGRRPITFEDWDRDADGWLDPRAFTAGVIIDDIGRAWDLDGDRRLRIDEVSAGLRRAFDPDGDGRLERLRPVIAPERPEAPRGGLRFPAYGAVDLHAARSPEPR